MKIAISSTGNNMDGDIASVFGRCPYFLIVEIDNEKVQGFEVVENISAGQTGGAGIATAQTVAEKEPSAVITGNVGPRASDVLKQFDIDVYIESGSIKDVLQKFIDGELKKSQ